jgi:predicted protein tyrosine phosphatase
MPSNSAYGEHTAENRGCPDDFAANFVCGNEDVARMRGRASADYRIYMKYILFLCGRNRLRSPTAERIFRSRTGIEVASAGILADAEHPVTPELIAWADVIFVMEETHRKKLNKRFRKFLKGKRILCLDIPDEYGYMDPRLIALLWKRVPKRLPGL